ncbi:MAG: hypothetical protein EOO77_46975 [Oxalobacteraceae bacterium]|uniref:hypothetical protein n=1 Tax=Sphingomonas sp. Leaf208 TaxID=1735679 RepID=UPI000701285E|nr:hypothetical protein [Sphingomonas sp. Leaf208]KQM51142.1 hypothetical protein ASE69_07405 [Sphingomonas sp. Leaf208]RYE92308.1 MAG: hypothetical protein EOO77_46975 [Oxalobacteraceae bacterium]
MKLPLAFIGLLLGAGPASAKLTVTTVPVGKLAVVTEVDDISDTPIMHAPLVTKKIRLEWRSADRRVRFSLNDDGQDLFTTFDLSKPDLSDTVCGRLTGGTLLTYQSNAASTERWMQFGTGLRADLIEICRGSLNTSQLDSYVSEFAIARSDFAPALEVMKASAKEQFGGWGRRCLKYKFSKKYQRPLCTRYSAKEE